MVDAAVAVPTGMSRLELSSKVEFAPGKSGLKETTDTKRALEEVHAYLVANPRVVKLRIEGHTDNTHDQKANVKLSGERALSIKKYLVKHGIPAHRVLAVGFGQAKPIADNTRAEGRAKNNRIEFEVAEIDGPKQGVDSAAGGRVFE
jgi:outer membrane protein OmpA-like peptidoglycan-associated protein